MSARSGITGSDQLTESFKDYISSGHRALFIKIVDESLVPGEIVPLKGSLTSDFDLINAKLSESQATYIIVKNDEVESHDNDKHIFISFVPDFAKVKDKMLYASTKNTVLKELGLEFFSMVLQLNELEEVSSKGWKIIQAHNAQENPLSAEEESLKLVKEMEMMSIASNGMSRGKRALVTDNHLSQGGNLKFKISDELKTALDLVSSNQLVTINIKDEELILTSVASLASTTQIVSKIPNDQPNYNIFKSSSSDLFFIYSCPSGSKVRDRMIYASTKLGFIDYLKSEKGLKFEKTIEVGDADEIELSDLESTQASSDDSSIASSSQASSGSNSLKFSKPKGPRRR